MQRGISSGFRFETFEQRVLLSGSAPSDLVAVGNRLFFVANDGVHGRELWVSDGTDAGTRLVRDINPGSADAIGYGLTRFGNKVAFTANDGAHGQELWVSDGTAAGTVLVKDILNGRESGFPTALTAIGDTLYFSGGTTHFGRELWKSDGTAAGTVMVKDIWTGSIGSSPHGFTEVNGTVFFSADATIRTGQGNHSTTTTYGRELWKTDGTAAGTVLVKDIRPGFGSSGPSHFVNLNGTLLFTAYTSELGFELWRSDGTAGGTQLVADIRPGFYSSDPRGLRVYEGTLYFNASDDVPGHNLWQSDGTSSGTRLATDFAPGFTGLHASADFFDLGGSVVFLGLSDTVAVELWRTDHTAGGTHLVHQILSPQLFQQNPYIQPTFGQAGSRVFFTAFNDAIGLELYVTNGTSTTFLKDIFPGNAQFDPSPQGFTDVNGRLFFVADDGAHGRELWTSDGTPAGTRLVKDIFPSNVPPSPIGSTLPARTPSQGTLDSVATPSRPMQDLLQDGEHDMDLLS